MKTILVGAAAFACIRGPSGAGENGNPGLEDLQAPELVAIGRIRVSTDRELGISGIAVDPDYSENRHIAGR